MSCLIHLGHRLNNFRNMHVCIITFLRLYMRSHRDVTECVCAPSRSSVHVPLWHFWFCQLYMPEVLEGLSEGQGTWRGALYMRFLDRGTLVILALYLFLDLEPVDLVISTGNVLGALWGLLIYLFLPLILYWMLWGMHLFFLLWARHLLWPIDLFSWSLGSISWLFSSPSMLLGLFYFLVGSGLFSGLQLLLPPFCTSDQVLNSYKIMYDTIDVMFSICLSVIYYVLAVDDLWYILFTIILLLYTLD